MNVDAEANSLPRNLMIYGGSAGIAMLLGYQLANPTSLKTIALLGLFFGVISLPLLLKWHHLILAGAVNASMIVFVLPGDPSVGVCAAMGSLGIIIMERSMRRLEGYNHVRFLAYPLILLAIVIVATAMLRGGVGGRAFGSDAWGGKRYLTVVGAIAVYFALVSKTIPRERIRLYLALFFLSAGTAVVSDLAYAIGPSVYFLFRIFPAEVAYLQAMTSTGLFRITGLAWLSLAGVNFMLAYYGVGRIMKWTRPYRYLIFGMLCLASLLGGYRSAIALVVLVFGFHFVYEGHLKTKLLAVTAGMGAVALAGMLAFLPHMPLSVQRSLSFVSYTGLPVKVHPAALADAQGTLDWRVEMWRIVWKDVPNYLWLGKGFSFSGTDFELTKEAIKRGMYAEYETALINGDYHSGPLTILIGFGVFGTVAFLWFCVAGFYALYRNYKYGPPHLKTANTFLLAYFSARLLFYFGLYGQFGLDLVIFTGTLGLGVALNGGVCSPKKQNNNNEENEQEAETNASEEPQALPSSTA